MRNNAAYLTENPIVYIIFPESIHNRASFAIFVGSCNCSLNIVFLQYPTAGISYESKS